MNTFDADEILNRIQTGDTLTKADNPAPLHLSFIHEMPKPEDYILKRSGLTLVEIYAADDWEDQRPQIPVPAPEAGQFVHAAPDILQARGKRQLH